MENGEQEPNTEKQTIIVTSDDIDTTRFELVPGKETLLIVTDTYYGTSK